MRGYRTKKISLPGGRVIEIVYFTEASDAEAVDAAAEAVQRALATPADEAAGAAAPPPSLHVCPSCGSDLVYPVEWEESSGTSWTVERRCPNCEWRHVGEFGDEELGHFDDLLNEGTETLLIALRDTTRANMEAAVERMIDAIKLDLIEPMDF
ncbi:MAG TPA: hypothetical protein VK904_02050 [Miltoncostaeaceae bacterium]|nr:hypothetical protein [Miltoncostaeaceae bacterium]